MKRLYEGEIEDRFEKEVGWWDGIKLAISLLICSALAIIGTVAVFSLK